MILKSRPPLSNGELVDLASQAQLGNGDAARRILESFVDMIHKDTRRFARLNVDDAESVALFAVSDAIRTFDASQGVPFRAWVKRYITGYLRNASAREFGCNTRASRKLFFNYAKKAAEVRNMGNGAEDCRAIADALQVGIDDILHFKVITAPKADVSELDIAETSGGQEKALAREEKRQLVQTVIECSELTEREIMVLNCLFPADDEETTLEDCGAVLGVSRQRVQQIKVSLLAKLKKTIDDLGLTAELSR